MTVAAVVIYFFFLVFAFIIGLPVFLASFFAIAIPLGVYANSFFPTFGIYLPFLLRADIALALLRASAFEDAPQACNDNSSLVGSPLALRSGPGIFPMRARNDALRGLSPDLTGGFNVPPL